VGEQRGKAHVAWKGVMASSCEDGGRHHSETTGKEGRVWELESYKPEAACSPEVEKTGVCGKRSSEKPRVGRRRVGAGKGAGSATVEDAIHARRQWSQEGVLKGGGCHPIQSTPRKR